MSFHRKAFWNNIGTYIKIINKYLSKNNNVAPLGKHIKIVGGYAFKSSEYQTEGIPVIRISDFQNEKIDLSKTKCYQESQEYDKYELKEGDIIIAMTGGTIGKLGIVQKDLGKLYLNQRVGKFQVLNPDKFYDRYVYWIARGVQEKVKNMGYGGAQPNISGKQIEAMKYPIPDKETQIKIVDFLRSLLDEKLNGQVYFDKTTEDEIKKIHQNSINIFRIEENSNSNSNYISKLRQEILSEAIQGKLLPQNPNDEPASVLLDKIKAEKEKLIKEKKIRKGKPLPPIAEGEIPYELSKKWVWTRLNDILYLSEYGTSQKSHENISGIPVYSMGNIDNWGNVTDGNLKKIPSTSEDLPRLLLKNNDLLFNRTNSYELVGKTGIYLGKDDTHTFASYLIRLRFHEYIDSAYAKYYLISKMFRKTQIEPQIIQQCGQANFNGTKLKSTLFPLPPLEEQKRIVAKIDELMGLCDQLESQVQNNQKNAEALMNAVLREAFEVSS